MVEVLRKKVSFSYEEAVKRVEDAMSAEGFTVLLTKDVSEIFEKKLDVEGYPRYTAVLGCKAPLAKMAMDVSKDMGTIFPCSFVIYEDGDDIYVGHTSIMKVGVETNLAPADEMIPVIEETGKATKAVWDRI